LNPENRDKWNLACDNLEDAWFWHRAEWIEYTLAYDPGKRKDLSFMIEDEGRIVGVCPLIMIETSDHKEFSFGGTNNWSPVCEDSYIRYAYEHTDELAKKHGVAVSRMVIKPFSYYNMLTKFGYMDTSISTQVIGFNISLNQNITKGHLYDIHKGMEKLEIHQSYNIAGYQGMHFKDAGRQTRPDETFIKQQNWINSNHGLLLEATHNGIPVGYSYTLIYKHYAYYASACSDPDYAGKNFFIGHVLNWKAMQMLKSDGINWYETGWQQFGPQLHDFPSKKDQDISKFKRGFGGITVPLYRGEKYYDRGLFDTTIRSRIDKYQEITFGRKES